MLQDLKFKLMHENDTKHKTSSDINIHLIDGSIKVK